MEDCVEKMLPLLRVQCIYNINFIPIINDSISQAKLGIISSARNLL